MLLCFIIIWKEGKKFTYKDTYFKALEKKVEDPPALIPYVKKVPRGIQH